MSDEKDLFRPDEADKHVDRLTKSQFERILKRGFDPAYVLRVEPDDRVTIAERPMRISRGFTKDLREELAKLGTMGRDLTMNYCVVLSKSRLDRNRRIVAQSGGSDKQWLVGLYVGLLRRQVKEGTKDIKAWAFETILDLERIEFGVVNQITLDNWTRDLIAKDDDIKNMKSLRRKKGVTP